MVIEWSYVVLYSVKGHNKHFRRNHKFINHNYEHYAHHNLDFEIRNYNMHSMTIFRENCKLCPFIYETITIHKPLHYIKLT